MGGIISVSRGRFGIVGLLWRMWAAWSISWPTCDACSCPSESNSPIAKAKRFPRHPAPAPARPATAWYSWGRTKREDGEAAFTPSTTRTPAGSVCVRQFHRLRVCSLFDGVGTAEPHAGEAVLGAGYVVLATEGSLMVGPFADGVVCGPCGTADAG